MSTIITEEVRNILQSDYTIHLTGDDDSSHQNTTATTTSIVTNPTNWPTNHRRVPRYRPIDRTRTQESRPNGSNAFEHAFLTIMFTGVVLNAVRSSAFWTHPKGPTFYELTDETDYGKGLGIHRRHIVSGFVSLRHWWGVVTQSFENWGVSRGEASEKRGRRMSKS